MSRGFVAFAYLISETGTMCHSLSDTHPRIASAGGIVKAGMLCVASPEERPLSLLNTCFEVGLQTLLHFWICRPWDLEGFLSCWYFVWNVSTRFPKAGISQNNVALVTAFALFRFWSYFAKPL